MHLSITSPTPPPGAHGVSGGDLSNQICTILHIWGIAFLANPLQYPMFSLGTPPWRQVNSVVLTRGRAPGGVKIQEQCPTMPDPWGIETRTNPLPTPGIPPRWGMGLAIDRCITTTIICNVTSYDNRIINLK